MDRQDGIDGDTKFVSVIAGDVFVGGAVEAGVFAILPLAGAVTAFGALGLWEVKGSGSACGDGSLTACAGVGWGRNLEAFRRMLWLLRLRLSIARLETTSRMPSVWRTSF